MIDGPTTPTAGPDTVGNLYRLTDRLRVDVHRPTDDDGEWVDAIAAGVTARDDAHRLEINELVAQLYREKALWVHAVGSSDFPGGLFGWRAESSPTGWWTGHLVRTDAATLRALVRNILPGEIRRTPVFKPGGSLRPH